ncbi:hypothetical protein, partial [Zavarzinella formosa]|uniref:hypothetical protein n=1 Tax=Zavarzinella formosa TaxID=360055 RepID=UPI001EE65C9E
MAIPPHIWRRLPIKEIRYYTADTLGRMLRDGFVPADRMVLAADGHRLSLGDLVSERIAWPAEDITVPSG